MWLFKTHFFCGLVFWSWSASSAPLIEKSGRFEVNWSTGKVRFYGTSMVSDRSEDSWRSAEQRAWGDGLSYLQSTPIKSMCGHKLKGQQAKALSNPLGLVSSVNTTYYGDSRIRVTLESQLDDLLRQNDSMTSVKKRPKVGERVGLIIKLSNKSGPLAAFSVVDESGQALVSCEDIANSTNEGTSLNRWFKSSIGSGDLKVAQDDAPKITADNSVFGVLKVMKSEWRPEFQDAIEGGHALLVVP
ncbi:MAG: hypothetical protein NTV34_06455 [Proteobacteria bacterium]|nr:hypothetical protein [Pseudomonadota bacterium]